MTPPASNQQAPFTSLAEIEQLVTAFEQTTLLRAEWTHRAHLTVATWYLAQHSVETATPLIRNGIRKLNAALGIVSDADHGYHETITRFYIGLIAHHLRSIGESAALDASPTEDGARTTPSTPSDGGEGRGEEERFSENPSPRSSPHSFLAGRGRKPPTQPPEPLARPASLVDAVNSLLANRGHVSLPLEYYRREHLMSREARAHWVEPDLKPFEWGVSDSPSGA